jgi:hypothetical protein
MANLIDDTYFNGDLHIAGTGNSLVLERLTLFITKYEDQLLQDLLGYSLYKVFKTGIAAVSPEAKWTDLRDGKEYTDSSERLRKWIGLKDASTKRSLIANWIYYWWLRDKVSVTTEIGEVLEKSNNSDSTSAAVKMVRAFNEMVLWIEELILFLNNNLETYPEWEQADIACIRQKFRPINRFNL